MVRTSLHLRSRLGNKVKKASVLMSGTSVWVCTTSGRQRSHTQMKRSGKSSAAMRSKTKWNLMSGISERWQRTPQARSSPRNTLV